LLFSKTGQADFGAHPAFYLKGTRFYFRR